MEDKINIAELLKDCPSGMELDCTLFEGLEFYSIIDNEFLPIRCRVKNPNGGYNGYDFTKYGCWLDTTFAKCVIFPKGKTTWEGFQRPFKDRDVLVHTQNNRVVISLVKGEEFKDKSIIIPYCVLWDKGEGLAIDKSICFYADNTRFATEKEKQKLFQAIKENGYKWNAETKTLEKLVEPKFKVGDRIKYKNNFVYTILSVESWGYMLNDLHRTCISLDKQDNYELFPDKFDITTLKPFDKVLVRVCDTAKWIGDFYMWYDDNDDNDDTEKDFPYNCVGGIWSQCIPYESNEHLLGTTDDCDDFYKTWE